MIETLLDLEGFGVAFGDRIVLASVDLSIPARGLTVLVGPAGVGKSTLVRTISGANDNNPSLRTWGRATFGGAPLCLRREGAALPALVAQRLDLLIGTVLQNVMSAVPDRSQLGPREQADRARQILDRAGLGELCGALDQRVIDLPRGVARRLSVARTAASEPRLLAMDEPTSDLDAAESAAMIALLQREAARRAVIFITHNQEHAREAGGTTALLAGGRVHEHGPTEEFFAAPLSRAAREFVRTGGCNVPSPGARPEDLADDVPPPPPLPPAARSFVPHATGPRGFRWLHKGSLGGTARPGIIDELDHDLDALRDIGVTVLVTLETEPLRAPLVDYGIRGLIFPIEDMAAPAVDAAIAHCARVAALIAEGQVVALHCRAGLGRTGTMLAAQLVHEGRSAAEALAEARRIEPRWVQSDEQIDFLARFERALRDVLPRSI